MSKYNHPLSYYKDILDNLHAGVYINQIEDVNNFSTASNVYINNHCIRMAGYTLAEFEAMGQGFFQRILKPEDVVSAIESIQFLCNHPDAVFSGLNRIVHKNGSDLWVYGNCKIFKWKNNKPWQFINVIIDIQDQIKTDVQLDTLLRENSLLKNQLKCKDITKREREIIKLIAIGKTDSDIANKLNISTYTAQTHRKNILHKLGVSNSAELVKFAMECGLY